MKPHVSAPALPGVMTTENAAKALTNMAVPLVWMVWP